MKQRLLLMVLALEMCGIMGSAQKKQYAVYNDGFEIYYVERVVNGEKRCGVEDRYGNMIIPTEYSIVFYICDTTKPITSGFIVEKDKNLGWYNKNGKCIVPYNRGYTSVLKCDEDDFGTFYHFSKPDGCGILDRNGREVASVKADGLSFAEISRMRYSGKTYYYFFLTIEKGGEEYCGIADAKGKIVVAPEHKSRKTAENLAKSRLTTTINPLAGNRHETLAEAEGRSSGRGSSYSSSSSSPSSSSSSDNNSGGGTRKVIVEHQHTPQPVQQWQACFACGGMGTMGCDNCGGSGTKYIGDRLHRCSRCNGRGIIPCNVCYGNKGQYITVYH